MAGRCVIIGAGDLSVSEIPLHEGDYVIAADGGFSYCRYLEIGILTLWMSAIWKISWKCAPVTRKR